MSSSRSIQAARNRRAGDSRLQTSSNIAKKPTTSINSQRVFSGNMNQNQNPNSASNEMSQGANNSLPFKKLTVSDAIGLITLRLGKVEQYLMEFQESDKTPNSSTSSSTGIDTTIFNNLVKRIEDLESNTKLVNLEKSNNSLINDFKLLKTSLDNLQLDLTNKVNDIENAFIDLEKNIDSLNVLENEQEEILVSSVENEFQVEDDNQTENLSNSENNLDNDSAENDIEENELETEN